MGIDYAGVGNVRYPTVALDHEAEKRRPVASIFSQVLLERIRHD